MSEKILSGLSSSQESAEAISMPVLPRDTGAKVIYSKMTYPKDAAEAAEYAGKKSLRRMPTMNCGILELHGVMGLLGTQGALEEAIIAAKASGYSDGGETPQEAGDGSPYGPSGYLIASTTGSNKAHDEKMEAAGFRKLEVAFNTIWGRGEARGHRFTLWGMFLNEEARTGKGNWSKEPFYVERAEARKKKSAA